MALEPGDDGLPAVSSEMLAEMSGAEIDALRRETPVVRSHPMRVTALRGHDVRRLAADPRLVQVPGEQFANAVGIPGGRCRSFIEHSMLMTNGPDHHKRRGAFARTFAHPVIKEKRAEIRAVADRIVADLPRGGPFDFLTLCASRLPAEIIAEILGLPVESSSWFAQNVYSLSRSLMVPYAIEAHDEIETAAETLYEFVLEALEVRRTQPREDLLSMLATDETARALMQEDLIYQVMTVILAGSDTTRTAFNMTVARLLEERSRWKTVCADRSLIPAAIDETLRLDPAVGSMPRFAPAPIAFGDLTVPGGQLVGLSSLSAMRDEAMIAEPDRFDLYRTDRPTPHLVFGGGAHRCLGEMLARIELEEGLGALMDAASGLEMIEAPRMLGFAGIRHCTPMIVRIPRA